MKDWSALEEAAQSMRRLNRAVAGFHAPEEELRNLARIATEIASRLESGDRRVKLGDMMTVPQLAAGFEGRPAPVDIGDELEFDPFSAGAGRLHRHRSTSSCAATVRHR